MDTPNAVLFDLYGTLTYEEPDSVTLQRHLAALIGVDADAFLAARSQTLDRSMRGEYATTRDRAEAVLELLSEPQKGGGSSAPRSARVQGAVGPMSGSRVPSEYHRPSDAYLEEADRERIDLLAREEERLRRQGARLYPGARETLVALTALGLRIGAVSNGTSIWRIFLDQLGLEQYFDAIAISCELGHCKPEAELFLSATDRLGVEPEECIFVGDGDGGEMEAARDLGMTAVLIDQPGSWVRRTGAKVYHDRRISHLGELLGIVTGPV